MLAESVRKADLETALQSVPDFATPDATLEQYPTPAAIAADLLFAAWEEGDIGGKRVLDLGCGTGVFCKGASLLEASAVHGVDVDTAAVEVAQESTNDCKPQPTFSVADVSQWSGGEFDTAIANPPFGAQRKHADRPFFEAAKRADVAAFWFLAQPKTERFLASYARELGGHLELILTWPYPIEARFSFHEQEVRSIEVGGYRMGWR